MKQGKPLLVLISLLTGIALAGCTSATPAAGVTPTQEANAPGSATETPAPNASPVPTAAPADTATATAIPATPTAVSQSPSYRAVVQLPDSTVAFVDAAGKQTPIGKSPGRLYSWPHGSAIARDTVYASVSDMPPGVYALNPSSVQLLSFIHQPVTGISVWPGSTAGDTLLAWGTYTSTGEGGTANIIVSKPDGGDAHAVVTETVTSPMWPSLMPLRWSADSKSLLYSSEPTGIGGYILFGGFSSLFRLDLATGVTTTVIPKERLGMICLDDLNQDATSITHHCNGQAIHVLNLMTNISTTISPPALVTDAAAFGTALFSPDGSRVAFAMARSAPENEQGWLAVSAGLDGEAKLIYTSQPGAYASVAGWLDADTIVFQTTSTSGNPDTIWAVNADGTNVRQLAEGNVLTLARSTDITQPAQAGGISWRQESGNCRVAQFDQNGVQFGPCDGALTRAGYAESWSANAYSHFIQTYAPFTAQTPAGTVTFTGTGQTVAAAGEQRMIAEFARLAAKEAEAGRGSAADEAALIWHREGGFAGFCDDAVISIYGEVSATSCRSKQAAAPGKRWLTVTQAEQLYKWIDTFKAFNISHDKPVQPDELVITATFKGNGTTEAADSDKQAILDFAQLQRTLVAQP